MRRVLWILVVFTAVIAVAWLLSRLPGTVTVSLAQYTIELATSLAVAAVVLIVLVLLALLQLLSWAWQTPGRIGYWRNRKRRASGDEAITRTLVAIAAGADSEAVRESARARRLLGDTPQTLLLAAEAGRLAKYDADATALYNKLADHKDAALLGLRGLFRQAMNREAWHEAALIAERAEAARPGGAWLREERAQLAVRSGNWAKALELTGPELPQHAIATAAAEAEPNPDQALRLARRAWKDHPGYAPAALAYAKRLRAAGQEVKALQTIRAAWAASPQPDLASFSLDPISDKEAKLREASRIVTYNPDHPESLYLLAGLHMQFGDLAEARDCLERAMQQGVNQKRFWLMRADLDMAEHGDDATGRLAQRDALRHAALADPDPAWQCEVCGTEQPQWRPVCPRCHTAGRISWQARRGTALVATAG